MFRSRPFSFTGTNSFSEEVWLHSNLTISGLSINSLIYVVYHYSRASAESSNLITVPTLTKAISTLLSSLSSVSEDSSTW